MSTESRRVELLSSVPQETTKKPKDIPRAIRLSVALFEASDASCPEFSYIDLLKNSLNVSDEVLDPNDPFAAEDKQKNDKLLAIGRAFEEKYGRKQKTKKSRKSEIRDLVDLGDGYDETDPFVDNTEAYDEYVPKALTTKFGGFYVNIGVLDFREVSDVEENVEESGNDESKESLPRKKKFKRHRLLSDSECADRGEKPLRKKLKEGGRDEKRMKKRKRLHCGNGSDGAEIGKRTTGMGLASKPNADSAARLRLGPGTDENGSHSLDGINASSSKVAISNCSADGAGDGPLVLTCTDDGNGSVVLPRLPDAVSPKLHNAIRDLTVAARQAKAEGRLFVPAVNQLLLQIEFDCRQLSNSVRSIVFMHLANNLQCEKEILIKRAKKLLLSHFDEQLKQPITLLREAVQSAMPALIEQHRSDVSATEQLRRERNSDGASKDSLTRANVSAASDSDENGLDDNLDAVTSNTEKQKRIMAPRRKFIWTAHLRTLLNNIVIIKVNQFVTSKIRTQTMEEYLKSFFEAELKPIWPTGWIHARTLFKESRSVHMNWTMNQVKTKKLALVTPTTSRTSSTPVPSGHEQKNGTPASVNVTPIAPFDNRALQKKLDRNETARHNVVILDDSSERKTSGADEVREQKTNISLELSKKVSFCPEVQIVHLPCDSTNSNSVRDVQPSVGSSSVSNDDSVELCRGTPRLDIGTDGMFPEDTKPLKSLDIVQLSPRGHDFMSKSIPTTKIDLVTSPTPVSPVSSRVGDTQRVKYNEKFADFLGSNAASSSAVLVSTKSSMVQSFQSSSVSPGYPEYSTNSSSMTPRQSNAAQLSPSVNLLRPTVTVQPISAHSVSRPALQSSTSSRSQGPIKVTQSSHVAASPPTVLHSVPSATSNITPGLTSSPSGMSPAVFPFLFPSTSLTSWNTQSIDIANREMLVQSLMNSSVEQRRKSVQNATESAAVKPHSSLLESGSTKSLQKSVESLSQESQPVFPGINSALWPPAGMTSVASAQSVSAQKLKVTTTSPQSSKQLPGASMSKTSSASLQQKTSYQMPVQHLPQLSRFTTANTVSSMPTHLHSSLSATVTGTKIDVRQNAARTPTVTIKSSTPDVSPSSFAGHPLSLSYTTRHNTAPHARISGSFASSSSSSSLSSVPRTNFAGTNRLSLIAQRPSASVPASYQYSQFLKGNVPHSTPQ